MSADGVLNQESCSKSATLVKPPGCPGSSCSASNLQKNNSLNPSFSHAVAAVPFGVANVCPEASCTNAASSPYVNTVSLSCSPRSGGKLAGKKALKGAASSQQPPAIPCAALMNSPLPSICRHISGLVLQNVGVPQSTTSSSVEDSHDLDSGVVVGSCAHQGILSSGNSHCKAESTANHSQNGDPHLCSDTTSLPGASSAVRQQEAPPNPQRSGQPLMTMNTASKLNSISPIGTAVPVCSKPAEISS